MAFSKLDKKIVTKKSAISVVDAKIFETKIAPHRQSTKKANRAIKFKYIRFPTHAWNLFEWKQKHP
ncbi:hypothetical protein [Aerosakkonema funiforme]|uniref:hypothetical protein n=1 Tax=Aerosakkonema funiforme TaxID=1246630 RepID=UPI001683D46B|nr:hypothetical protein [Aerosakkonema funiforme]